MAKKTKLSSANKSAKVRKNSSLANKGYDKKQAAKKKSGFWAKTKKVLIAPLRFIGRIFTHLWSWICHINIVLILNLTLLIVIIILFLLLIINLGNFDTGSIILTKTNKPEQIAAINFEKIQRKNAIIRPVKKEKIAAIPLKKVPEMNEFLGKFVIITKIEPSLTNAKRPAKRANIIYGDVVIDGRKEAHILHNNMIVRGNLYLQNMKKYVLPCNLKVEGNLFLRNINMLQFCGKFSVKKNIYVSPHSSFDRLPRDAKLGGYVIL